MSKYPKMGFEITAPTDAGLADRTSVPKAARTIALRYLIAVLCVLIAFAIRYWLSRVLGEELPFMFFIAAALLAAWSGGATAGIVALFLGLFLADHFFVPHTASGSLTLFRLIRYCFTASLGIVLIEVLHRGRRRTESMVTSLAREIRLRRDSEEALLQARNRLVQYAVDLEGRVAERTRELSEMVDSLQELQYQIAHNLRAPLRAMDSYSQILLDDCASSVSPLAQEYARRISVAAKRMDQLVQDVLEYGRLTHVEVPLQNTDFGEALRRAISHLADKIQSTNAQITASGPWPVVFANADLLADVLERLLDNAIKFVPAGAQPRIRIWTDENGKSVRFWVEDNGIGIDPRFHERVFNLFESLKARSSADSTGAGLAIVRRAMHRMSGLVGLESKSGSGTRFWIELPKR